MSTTATASTMGEAEFTEKLQAYVGVEDGPTTEAFVDPTVIARLTEAIGDRNPIYSNPAVAESTIHGAVVAPVTMLMCWTVSAKPRGRFGHDAESGDDVFRLEAAPNGSANAARPDERSGDRATEWGAAIELREALKAAGFIAPAVTNAWFEYKRYLRPGEPLVIGPATIDEVAGPKTTSLGTGYFVTQSQQVLDAKGEVVAVVRQRILRSKPADRSAASSPGDRPARPAPERDERLSGVEWPFPDQAWTPALTSAAVGDRLPELLVAITPTQIIAGAIASQDWAPVHHDRDFAHSVGHPDIFTNVQTSTGYVGRFVTDWAGPNAVIEALDLRLGVPSYAYDSMRMTGEVTGVEAAGDRTRVTVAVAAKNSLGVHISSNVTLTVPGK